MAMIVSALLFATLSLRPDADLRIYNPHDEIAGATIVCEGASQRLRIPPRGVIDVAEAGGCTAIESFHPLTVIEARGEDVQRVIETDAACDTTTVMAPLFACKAGRGTAAVPVVEGATYSWSVEGASIIEGAGTPRVTLSFAEAGNVKLTCMITTAECSSTGTAVIAVREPIAIEQLTVPQTADTNAPVTITWNYGASTPTSQVLAGDALDAPVILQPGARSYTFTPTRTGSKSIELRASYFASLPAAPSNRRRRAAGRSVATATECTAVTATRRMEVSGCNSHEPAITLPQEVDAGDTFEARVDTDLGEQAEFSVENGTILAQYAFDGRAMIRAGESGDLKVTAILTRGSCSREAESFVRIIPAAKQCPASPMATLTLVSRDCNRAVVRAAFTGAPPFRGTWSDGTPFFTQQSVLEHDFTTPGAYGMTFRDESCIGVVAGSPSVDTFRARATLTTVGGNCTNAKLVATFTGTPPFTFTVLDWQTGLRWVTTNEFVYEHQLKSNEYAIWRISNLFDSVCSEVSESNTVNIVPAAHAEVLPDTFCTLTDYNDAVLRVSFNTGRPPFTATWSDGVTTTSNAYSFHRAVPKPAGGAVAEYTLVRATAGDGCEADLGNTLAKVTYRPMPLIDHTTLDFGMCPGQIGTATLERAQVPPPNATLHWTVPGGEILSGQGTPTITFRPTSTTVSRMRVEATYPEGLCSTFSEQVLRFYGVTQITDFQISKASILKGGSAHLSFSYDENVEAVSISVDPSTRRDELSMLSCENRRCTATFTDTRGAGTVTFGLHSSNPCPNCLTTVYSTLTVDP